MICKNENCTPALGPRGGRLDAVRADLLTLTQLVERDEYRTGLPVGLERGNGGRIDAEGTNERIHIASVCRRIMAYVRTGVCPWSR